MLCSCRVLALCCCACVADNWLTTSRLCVCVHRRELLLSILAHQQLDQHATRAIHPMQSDKMSMELRCLEQAIALRSPFANPAVSPMEHGAAATATVAPTPVWSANHDAAESGTVHEAGEQGAVQLQLRSPPLSGMPAGPVDATVAEGDEDPVEQQHVADAGEPRVAHPHPDHDGSDPLRALDSSGSMPCVDDVGLQLEKIGGVLGAAAAPVDTTIVFPAQPHSAGAAFDNHDLSSPRISAEFQRLSQLTAPSSSTWLAGSGLVQ